MGKNLTSVINHSKTILTIIIHVCVYIYMCICVYMERYGGILVYMHIFVFLVIYGMFSVAYKYTDINLNCIYTYAYIFNNLRKVILGGRIMGDFFLTLHKSMPLAF